MLYDEWTAVYADDFVFWESALHALDGFRIRIGCSISGKQNGAVYEQKVCIGGWKSVPFVVKRRFCQG